MNYITTARKPSVRVRLLAKQLSAIFSAEYITRGKNSISDLISDARYNGVEFVLILTEKDGNPKQLLVMEVNDKTWEWKDSYNLKIIKTRAEISKAESNIRFRSFKIDTENRSLLSLFKLLHITENEDSDYILRDVKKGISVFNDKLEIGPNFDISYSQTKSHEEL